MKVDRCWYKQNKECSFSDPCDEHCSRFHAMNFLVTESEIPLELSMPKSLYPQEIDVPSFKRLAEIKRDIYNFVKDGNSIYLYSETCGNGKTTWASKLFMSYFDNIWDICNYECKGLFISVPDFLLRAKFAFTNNDAEFMEFVDKIQKVDLVVFDDIGACADFSKYEISVLDVCINGRIANNRSSIFTSNLSMNNIYNILGSRLGSRIVNNSECIELKGMDRRGLGK